MTHLCVPIFVSSLEQARRDPVLAAEHGADLVEFRIDTFTDVENLKYLVKSSPLPSILTCRSSTEGGHSTLSDEERVKILDATTQARYVDLELQTFKQFPSFAEV